MSDLITQPLRIVQEYINEWVVSKSVDKQFLHSYINMAREQGCKRLIVHVGTYVMLE